MMLYLGALSAGHLMNMKWALIETNEENPFVISDNFYAFISSKKSYSCLYPSKIDNPLLVITT